MHNSFDQPEWDGVLIQTKKHKSPIVTGPGYCDASIFDVKFLAHIIAISPDTANIAELKYYSNLWF